MPTKGRSLVIGYLARETGREVTLESLYYNPLRGVVLKNLTISDDPEYKRKFLEIEKLYLNILYIPLFKEKKLVISSVRVDSPRIIFTIDDRNKWNFESLAFLNRPKAAPEGMNVLVNSVLISGASCVFEDLAVEPVFRKELKDVNFRASLSYPLKIKYRFNSELNVSRDNSISADGQFDPFKKSATLNLKLKNIPLPEFQPYYEGMPFEPRAGIFTGDVSAFYSQENSLTIASVSSVVGADLAGKDLTAKSDIDLSGKISIDLKDKTNTKMPCIVNAAVKLNKLDLSAKGPAAEFGVKGSIDANAKFSFDLKDKTAALKYSADTQLRDTRLTGVPVFGAIDRINGKIYFDETKLWTDLLKGLARGFDCVFSGTIKDYNDPDLTLTAKTDLDLARLNELLPPDLKEKLKGYALSGVSKVSLNLNGLIKQQDKVPLSYVVTADLLDCAIKPDFADKPVKSINGNLIIKPDSLALRNVSGFFNDKKYLLSGDISDFKVPVCDLSLSSDDLKLKTSFKYLEDSITFAKFDGRYKNTVFNLAGSYADFKDPALDIKGNILTELREILPYLPKENSAFFEKLEPATSFSSDFEFKGKTGKQETWSLKLNRFSGKSPAFDFDALGSIDNFKEPLLDVRGSLTTTVEEIKKFLPAGQAESISKNNIAGDISSKFVFKGKQKDRNTWQVDLIADSPRVRVKKLEFGDCHLEGKFKDNFVTLPRVTSSVYDGTLAANAVIDFNKQNPQYVVGIAVREIDISKWKNTTEMKDKDLRGRFSANADLGGFANDLNTLKGSGRFEIKDGRFWELPVFSGIANILYIPGVHKIIFGEARGTFSIADKSIYTEDTIMSSPQMNLAGNGNLDFDGGLDFQVTASFNKNLLEVASSLGPLRDLLIDREGNYLSDIKLGGTTKEPKFKIKLPTLDKILQNKLFDNIKKGLFGDSAE